MIINHHPLIDYTTCYECKFDLPEHEAFKLENKDFYCILIFKIRSKYNKILKFFKI